MSLKNSLDRVKTKIKDGMFIVLVDNKVIYKEFAKLTKKEQETLADVKKAIKKLCKTQKIKDLEHHAHMILKFIIFSIIENNKIKFEIRVDTHSFQFINLPPSLNWLQDISIQNFEVGIKRLSMQSKEYLNAVSELKRIEEEVNSYSDALKDSIHKEYCYL